MPNAEEYEKEWRASVLTKLDKLEAGQNGIKDDISALKLTIPSHETINDMETRLREIEKFKTSAQTLFFVIQFVIGGVLVVVDHLWK